jgi:phosphoribosyl 1,2-cyclic phosphodiesterase
VLRNLGHGGNTPCASVEAGADNLLIFDAGSGLRVLGAELLQRPALPTLHLFFTHFHWDHIQGLPFFAPLYDPRTHLVLHSVHQPEELHDILARQMTSPFFPVDFSAIASRIEFRQIHHSACTVAGITVQGFPLHHPQGAQGYRIASVHKTIVFATDHEHGNAVIDANLRTIAHNADVLLYDAQYTPAEYQQREGWGHSTWLEAVNVARDANVGKLVLFHHDPNHDDATLEAIAAEAQLHFPNTFAAREGTAL